MSFTSALVAIVAIIAWAYLRSTRGSRDHSPAETYSAQPALEREVVDLRKRVEVLERILTDGRDASRLAQDIEALRE